MHFLHVYHSHPLLPPFPRLSLQFFVAPLRDSDGQVVNYVGVQCKVSEDFARAIAQSEGAEKGGLKDLSNP